MQAFVKENRCEPVHLVLTQTHRPETRKQAAKRLRDAFNKLVRRDFWKEHFKGGTWSLEFTKDENGLHHAHFHIVAFRSKFFHIDRLRDEWRAVTGDSHVLRLDKISDLTKSLLEVMKYVSKPTDIKNFTKDDLADFMKLKKMQMFGTFGEYRKFSIKFSATDNDTDPLPTDLKPENRNLVEGCACPQCDEPLFEMRQTQDEFVDFLQRAEMSPRLPKCPPS